jgi:tRNA pseudouridine13 synthase
MTVTESLPAAHSPAVDSARYKSVPEDFLVEEQLSFEPSGEGEHLLLWVEKRGANTAWVAKQLAHLFNVKERDVSYAGLKDRHAVTRQWFGIHLPGQSKSLSLKEPDLKSLSNDEFSILKGSWNNRKLRHGAIAVNRFELVLRDIQGDRGRIEDSLNDLLHAGFPNYFGEQRFGRVENNVEQAVAMLNGGKRVRRHQASIYLSALRSWFFNRYLAERVTQQNWNRPQPGDRLNLNGSRSHFEYTCHDEDILQRL